MYRNILIPVALDHEGLVTRKIGVARLLLALGGRITLLTVLEDIPGFVSEFVDLKDGTNLTARVREKLEKAHDGGADIRTEVTTGKAGVVIAQHARDNHCDLILVGSHHPGIQDYFLGPTAARVARRAPCSVMIMR